MLVVFLRVFIVSYMLERIVSWGIKKIFPRINNTNLAAVGVAVTMIILILLNEYYLGLYALVNLAFGYYFYNQGQIKHHNKQ